MGAWNVTKRMRCVGAEGLGGARSLGADRVNRHQCRFVRTEGSLKEVLGPDLQKGEKVSP